MQISSLVTAIPSFTADAQNESGTYMAQATADHDLVSVTITFPSYPADDSVSIAEHVSDMMLASLPIVETAVRAAHDQDGQGG